MSFQDKFYNLPKIAQAAIVVALAATLDFTWILWVRAVAKDHILYASLLSSLLGTISLFGVTTVIEKRWTYPLWVAGLGLGTALAMLVHLQ